MSTGLQNIGSIGVKAFGAVATGVTAASVAVGTLVTASVNAYASYEQLVGGVDTLFKDSSAKVQEYADEAYKTAGLSANEYMSSVTGFSASLLQSLDGDTAAAADKANQAIIDMSDNANKMGTDMAMIQNAYAGFAKQNYTMLDNLKLGYGGTEEEMERLLEDATKISGIEYDISSYADIVDAIHVVQTEMGITGTTASEASTTIAGSTNAMKAAWSNLMIGIADDSQDFDALVNNFVDSVGTMAENIIPRVETAIGGVGDLIEKLLPVIIGEIPYIIDSVLPDLLESGINMVSSIITGIQTNLPQLTSSALEIVMQLVSAIIGMLPQLLEIGLQIIVQLALGIAEALPELVSQIVDIMLQIVQILIENIPMLIDAGLQIILGLIDGLIAAIPVLILALPQIVDSIITALTSSIPLIINAGIQLLTSLVSALPQIISAIVAVLPQIISSVTSGLITMLPQLIDCGIQLFLSLITALPQIITTIVGALPQIIDAVILALLLALPQLIDCGIQLFMALIGAMPEILEAIVEALPQIIESITTALLEMIPELISCGIELFLSIISELPSIIVSLCEAVPKIVTALVSSFDDLIDNFVEVGVNIVEGLWNGIQEGWTWLTDKVEELASDLYESAKEALGIHSPSIKFRYLGEMCVAGFDKGLDGMEDIGLFGDIEKGINATIGAVQANNGGTTRAGASFTANFFDTQTDPDAISRKFYNTMTYGLAGAY